MSHHGASPRGEDVAIVLMVILMAVIIFLVEG